MGKTWDVWVPILALPLSVWDLNHSVCLPEPGFSHLYQERGDLGNNGYLAGLLWGYSGRVCVNLSAQHLAHRGAAAGVPSHPGSQQGLGKAPGRLGGGGRMFLRGRLLLGAFKSFSRGSCLCIRLQRMLSQERGALSELQRLRHPPTLSLTHAGHLGSAGGGRGCVCTLGCVHVCAQEYGRKCYVTCISSFCGSAPMPTLERHKRLIGGRAVCPFPGLPSSIL